MGIDREHIGIAQRVRLRSTNSTRRPRPGICGHSEAVILLDPFAFGRQTMLISDRCHSFSFALALSLPLLTGCDALKEHYSFGAVELQFEKLDRTSNKLERLTPPTTQRTGASIAAVGGKLYFFGGLDRTHELASEVEIYDPTSKTYTMGAAWPNPKTFVQKLVLGNEVCFQTATNGTSFDCYDTMANTWKTVALLPNGMIYSAGQAGDQLYAVADDLTGNPGGAAFKLDAKTNTWTNISFYPGSSRAPRLIGIDSTLYALPVDLGSLIYRYDPTTDKWTSMPLVGPASYDYPQHLTYVYGIEAIGSEIVTYSGMDVAVFNPAKYDATTMMTGVRMTSAGTPRAILPSTATTSDAFWISVNDESDARCGEVHSYTPATDTWTPHVTRPVENRICISNIGALGDEIFILTSLEEHTLTIQ
jgi:Kelch motif